MWNYHMQNGYPNYETFFQTVRASYDCHRASEAGLKHMGRDEYQGPFYKHGLTLIPAWISNYIHYNVCDKIT